MSGLPDVGFDAVVHHASKNSKLVGVFSDLDGTLSNLVETPDAAHPVDGAVAAMTTLAGVAGRAAIVSGRPVSFIERFFSAPVEMSGLYGIEHRSGNELTIHPDAAEWQPVIHSVAAEAAQRFGASAAEDKGYSLTVHYRNESNDVAAQIAQWSEAVATEHGLHLAAAKMSVELHPPVSRNKGDAIADMVDGLSAAVYFGDDLGDRSGFERLLAAQAEGQLDVAAAVLVNGPETPAELADVATDLVSTPDDVVAMLNQLIEVSSSASES